jgi:hypothetical protein
MTDSIHFVQSKLSVVALINCNSEVSYILSNCNLRGGQLIHFKNGIELLELWNQNDWNIIAVISQSEVMSPSGVSLLEILNNKKGVQVPLFIICKHWNEKILKIALQAGVAEVFQYSFDVEKFETR